MAAGARWTIGVTIPTLLAALAQAAPPPPPLPPPPAASPPAAPAVKAQRKTIEAQVRTEPWKGWDEGEPVPDGLVPDRTPEKFQRFETPPGEPPTFSGKVIGLPPGKVARVGVVANRGTQWIQPANYKYVNAAPDGSFTLIADHRPDAPKSLMVSYDGRLATFLRAQFAPSESAKNIELRLGEPGKVVLTMADAQGRDVNSFRVEVFTPYRMKDDAGRTLPMQRLAAATTAGGAIVFDAPPEPIGVLLAAGNVAPHYEVIDPRDAGEFHFKMLAPSRIRGVVTRGGQPLAGVQIFMVNEAAPLSATLRKTDAQGRFDMPGRVPGHQHIRVAGYRTSVYVQPDETAEVNLEIGTATPRAVVPTTPAAPASPAAPAATSPAARR